jgi:hypothetical protein
MLRNDCLHSCGLYIGTSNNTRLSGQSASPLGAKRGTRPQRAARPAVQLPPKSGKRNVGGVVPQELVLSANFSRTGSAGATRPASSWIPAWPFIPAISRVSAATSSGRAASEYTHKLKTCAKARCGRAPAALRGLRASTGPRVSAVGLASLVGLKLRFFFLCSGASILARLPSSICCSVRRSNSPKTRRCGDLAQAAVAAVLGGSMLCVNFGAMLPMRHTKFSIIGV